MGLTRLALALALTAGVLLGSTPSAAVADAAESGDWAAVKSLLAQDGDVNAAQVDGMTALHWASYHDNAEAVRTLLDAGAKVEAANRYEVTPLSLAAENGSAPIVRLLLESGADPNRALPGGETALMTAARTGRIEAVRALLSAGAEADAALESGQTALMWAAAEGHADVVELLIEYGADFRRRLESGFTPLLFAVREGRAAVVRALLDAGADPNDYIDPEKPQRRPRPGTSALLLAAENAHFELGAMLLDAGADPNADRTGYTVLHAVPVARNPGVGDNDPPPPGSGAMSSIEFVRKLVASGADIDAHMTEKVNLGNTRLNKMGATPFFIAAQSADAELLSVLAELGTDTTLTNEDNSTPLMAATGIGTRSPGEDAGTEEEVLKAVRSPARARRRHRRRRRQRRDGHARRRVQEPAPRVVEYLAERGADMAVWNNENAQGWTPLTIAYGYRFGNFKPSPPTIEALQRLLLAAGLTPPPPPNSGGVSDYRK